MPQSYGSKHRRGTGTSFKAKAQDENPVEGMDVSGTASRRSSTATDFLDRNPVADTISPLPKTLENGLVAISIFSLLSFILSTLLWSYLSYKLISWRMRWKSRARAVARNLPQPPALPVLDFHAGDTRPPGESAKMIHQRNADALRRVEDESPNQFLILIYNLFLADMHQAVAFLVSAVWLSWDGIFIQTPACFVQGFFDTVGELVSCCFITFIAVHTYLSVVKGYRPPQRVLYVAIVSVWAMAYLIPALSILATMNGRELGGFYTRAGAWCLISRGYWMLRIFTHYIFIFASIVITVVLYIAIYTSLRRQTRLSEVFPDLKPHHQRAFLIYPLAFVLCTLPLAGGRIAVIAGMKLPMAYQVFAGAMASANGLLNSAVFGSTRHSIIFGSMEQVAAKSTGLETFSFMRTPANRFGNEVWIQGGTHGSHADANHGVGGWWPFRVRRGLASRPATEAGSCIELARSQNRSSEVLGGKEQEQHRHCEHNGMVIHMDVVTALTVEVEDIQAHSVRCPEPSLGGERPSFGSSESLCRWQERHWNT